MEAAAEKSRSAIVLDLQAARVCVRLFVRGYVSVRVFVCECVRACVWAFVYVHTCVCPCIYLPVSLY